MKSPEEEQTFLTGRVGFQVRTNFTRENRNYIIYKFEEVSQPDVNINILY